jgi:hypothetical protein
MGQVVGVSKFSGLNLEISVKATLLQLDGQRVPRARALSVVVPMVGWLCWIGLIDVDVCMGVPGVPSREKLY